MNELAWCFNCKRWMTTEGARLLEIPPDSQSKDDWWIIFECQCGNKVAVSEYGVKDM